MWQGTEKGVLGVSNNSFFWRSHLSTETTLLEVANILVKYGSTATSGIGKTLEPVQKTVAAK